MQTVLGHLPFINRAAQLTAFNCHVLYTMPISLAYSYQENAIKSSYGGHVPVVPMTKIATRPPTKPHEPGIRKFREIIGASSNRGAVEMDPSPTTMCGRIDPA